MDERKAFPADSESMKTVEIVERVKALSAEIEKDKVRFNAQVECELKTLKKMERRFAPVRIFGHTSRQLRIPIWLAGAVVVVFIAVLLWAATRISP